MSWTIRSLLALAVIGTAAVATLSARRKIACAKEKVRGAAAIDRWENEGGSAPLPDREIIDSR